MPRLYKHKRDGWQVEYWITFLDGTRKLKYKVSSNLQKAAAFLQDAKLLEAASKAGLKPDELEYFLKQKLVSKEDAQALTVINKHAGLTWDDLEEHYWRRFKSLGSESSLASYRYVSNLVAGYFKDRGITPLSLTVEDVQGFIEYRRGEGKAKATCNKNLDILRIMLDKAVALKAIPFNPARNIKTYKDVDEKVPRILFPTEFEIFIQQIDNKAHLLKGYFKEMMLTYLYTGLRSSELLRLKISDFNKTNGYFTINNTKNNRGRVIPIHIKLMPVIESVIEKNKENKGAYLFGGKDKPLCLAPSVTHAFMELELPGGVHLYSLRHTFISYLVREGVSLKEVQRLAGHKNLNTTFRYTHFIPGKDTVEKLNFGI